MRTIFFLLISLFQSNIFAQVSIKLLNDDCPTKSSTKYFKFVHIESEVKENDSFFSGQIIGKVSKLPSRLSNKFDKEILLSQKAYENNDFGKASSILEKAYKYENNNPFILNQYARTLYRIEDKRDQSFLVYKKLVMQLDSEYKTSDSIVIIDLWFKEAYWKLGTLYMDYGQWENAKSNGMVDQIVKTTGRCLNTALRVASNRSLPNNTIFSPQNWIKSKQSLNDINAAIEQYIDMLPTMEGGEQQYEKLKNTITVGQEQFEYRLQAE